MKRRIILIALFALSSACAPAQDNEFAEETQETETPSLVVINVASNDVLNMRAEPDANAAIVGTLPPNTGNIHVAAQSAETGDWIYIEANELEGWVNANYLAYANSYAPLPIRLHCSGTEPFWGIALSYSRADVDFAYSDEDFRTGFHPPISPANRTNIWLRTRFDLESDFLLLQADACSDGMSEQVYAYSLMAKLNGNLIGGCCN
nr:MAG: hypothetical protein E4H34_01230 [Hyphomicrobiales bacterium]